MMSAPTEIPLGGGRVLRAGLFSYVPAGEAEPVELVYLATGWATDPPLPLGPDLVCLPVESVPAVRAALERLGTEE